MFLFAVLQIGDALGKNLATILIMRFLAGTFAASPLTNCGGVIAGSSFRLFVHEFARKVDMPAFLVLDIWDPIGRGQAMSVFSASVFLGPVVGYVSGVFAKGKGS
jgi:DHA1 family multidrug resistance protein-like MFS transporter